MKIAITAQGKDLNTQVDPRFGRCTAIIIYDTETKSWESIDNQNAQMSGGAGIQTAQTISEKNVEVLLTGNIGPNAFQTLSAANIDVYTNVSGIVTDAITQFNSGQLEKRSAPSVESHAGMKQDVQNPESKDIRRIAIASEGEGSSAAVSAHFGRCPYYHLVDIKDNKVVSQRSVTNPFFNSHGQPGQVPQFINEQGAHVILAGGMGQRAVGFFQQFGIEVATGVSGSIENAVESYLKGSLSGYTPCNHDQGDCQ